MTSTLNDDSSTNKMDFGKWIAKMFQRRQHDYRHIDGCFHKNFEVYFSRSFSKQKKLMFKETKTFILMMCSNYALNISVIIGSMMATSKKTLQFISVTVLKIIFKPHSGKDGLWTDRLDA